MKKLILSAIVIATIAFSCKKENKKEITPGAGATTEPNSTLTAARVLPHGNMEDYITDAADPQNERVNKALYAYMVGMRKVFETDPNYLSQALQYARQSSIFNISAHNFICQSSACKIIFNGELCSKYPEKGTGYDHCVKILEEMDYKVMEKDKVFYEPGMLIINAATATLDQGYYLALAEDVYNDDQNHEYIPAWHILKNGTVRLELINEQQASQTKEPVIIFNPVNRYYGTGPYVPYNPPTSPIGREPFVPPAPPVGTTWTSKEIYHKYVQISIPFDLNGPSQYYISYVISGDQGEIIKQANKTPLDNVPSNYVDCHCYYSLYSPFFTAAIYNTVMTFVTYEHDWWAGPKYLTPGGNYQLEYKCKYDGETYQEVGNMIIGSRVFDGAGENTIATRNYGGQDQLHGIVKQ